MDPKYGSVNLTLDKYDYSEWYKEKSDDSKVKSDEEELYDSPTLENDEESYGVPSTPLSKGVKKAKLLKILTPSSY